MSKEYLSTAEIIKRGSILNEKHEAYKKATGEEKMVLWNEFYEAWQKYRQEVHDYVKTNPIDVSDSL